MNPTERIASFLAVLVLAPLVQGIVKALRARAQGRPGPDVLQSYRDLRKLLAKESVVAENTSPIVLAAPGCVLGAALTVAGIVPALDAVAIALTLGLGRFVLVLAALDTRSGFEGMAASREIAFAALSELPLVTAVLGATLLPTLPVARALGAAALLIVLLFETARIPVDSQETHYELTMIHEGQALEYGGWQLALLQYAAYVRQLGLLLLAALLLWGGVLAAPLWIAAFILAGALFERRVAKLRLFEVPQLFAIASILALAALGAQLAGATWW
ncbi:MAG: NADH-quinone oxidoreductase subunit H [Candidatus Eremiobacteraeota bacterium]|nr:NADH-quinone oxidoreductase subunit H [Candidatus Eremiobacteraeota bacterium]